MPYMTIRIGRALVEGAGVACGYSGIMTPPACCSLVSVPHRTHPRKQPSTPFGKVEGRKPKRIAKRCAKPRAFKHQGIAGSAQ
eukprot:3467170-Pleurochrysis_carterae.AAC.1